MIALGFFLATIFRGGGLPLPVQDPFLDETNAALRDEFDLPLLGE